MSFGEGPIIEEGLLQAFLSSVLRRTACGRRRLVEGV